LWHDVNDQMIKGKTNKISHDLAANLKYTTIHLISDVDTPILNLFERVHLELKNDGIHDGILNGIH
jgi:hypothetical protein